MSAPLDGIRVLDLTSGMSGAIATMLLADYGAEVIRIDRPCGELDQVVLNSEDDARDKPSVGPAATRPWNRGKRGVQLDLDDAVDHSVLMDLVEAADVVIVGLSSSSVSRFSLGIDELTAVNPDLIYVSLTGFGLDDDRATPGLDALAAAELGCMIAGTAHHRDGPVFLGHPAIAFSTAFVTLIGTLAALRARIVSGQGDVVDVSVLDGVLAQFTMNWWTERKVSFLANRRPDGELDLGRTRMLVRRYRCRDGRLIQVHTGAAGGFARLMKVVGIDAEISPAVGAVESASPLTDHDLELLAGLPAIFATRTADEWLTGIWAGEVAGLPVYPPGTAFSDAQVLHNGLIRTIDDPDFGTIDVVAAPIQMSVTPPIVTTTATPTRDVRVTGWIAAGLEHGGNEPLLSGPLDGIRVVELATFFASPYANRFLRDLGATVIKVEATSGDPIRSLPDPFEGVSRGKRSLAIDMKSPSARPLLDEILRRADVVQHNFRPGAAERLGVDYASVAGLNPGVVYCYAPGFGSTGPKSRLQSFAPLLSGFVGIHTEAAGTGNPPISTYGNEDYYNGQLNAVGMLLALVHKARTDVGQYVECAQLSSAVFVTSHWYRANGKLQSVLPQLDRDQLGWSPERRIYQCLDGWLCVYCTKPAQAAALRQAVLSSGVERSQLGEALQFEFVARTADEWVDLLRAVDVPCAVVRETSWLNDFLRDPASIEAGRATPYEHHQHGQVSAVGRIVQLRNYRPNEPVRAPRLGEHSRAIAREMGVDAADVDAMIAAKVLVES